MGIKGNIRKIIDYRKYRNLEKTVNREVIKRSIVETDFYSQYSSFIVGLKEKLDFLLIDSNYLEVVFRPVEPDKAKYFEKVLQDRQFQTLYHIKRTSGGEYAFRQRLLVEEDLF